MSAKVEAALAREVSGATIMKTSYLDNRPDSVCRGALCITLLTLFGLTTVASQYVKFAIMLLMFVVILVGSYWSHGAERKER